MASLKFSSGCPQHFFSLLKSSMKSELLIPKLELIFFTGLQLTYLGSNDSSMGDKPWTFDTVPTDHAETPTEAYEDVSPVLDFIGSLLCQTRASLRIWDPFFCQGTMVQRLASLGFESVTNRNEDAYAVMSSGHEPPHDVLLTNPPFRSLVLYVSLILCSGDHIQRVVEYFAKPENSELFWLLLVPQYIDRKAYFMEFKKSLPEDASLVYLGPTSNPYMFSIPRAALDTDSREPERPTTIFQCIWFIHVGKHRKDLLSWWEKNQEREGNGVLCTTAEGLPQLAEKASVKLTPAERRWRKKLKKCQKNGDNVEEMISKGSVGRKRKPQQDMQIKNRAKKVKK